MKPKSDTTKQPLVENILVRWVNDKFPPIDLNEHAASVHALVNERKALLDEIEKLKKAKTEAMLIAMEYGYKQCEKGNNLDMAFINFNKLIKQD